jgi:hypothetical protein
MIIIVMYWLVMFVDLTRNEPCNILYCPTVEVFQLSCRNSSKTNGNCIHQLL